MNYQLIRTQVYLNSYDVTALDAMAKKIRISRSQIIRDATTVVAKRYAELFVLLSKRTTKHNPILDLEGIGQSPTGTVGLTVDEIYNDV